MMSEEDMLNDFLLFSEFLKIWSEYFFVASVCTKDIP